MSKELRNALGCFATGVTVVTTRYKGQDYGMTCSSFNAVSLEPAMALWSIQKTSQCLEAFQNSEGYTVSVLSAEQGELAMHFTRGSQEERFADLSDEHRLDSGRIVIPGSSAWFDCDLRQVIEAGDHYILLSNILQYGSSQDTAGLIFERSQFGSMQQLKKVA
ncbi:flavin reductase family protein [Leucothrix arctica]|uniref:Flavin reductase n=1 Tax=Leucothrix arctica TaxID=1481894 RepID=A0A317CSE6_9GAMM|nr:flavin reductase family protein [Leucothrix arctica]PWQ99360.1 flavin reductase [Leucothrix arctica]